MKQIKEFNKASLATVRKEIDMKLKELSALGLDISIGNISFDSDSFTSKLTCRIRGGEDEYAKDFKRNAIYFDMKPEQLNQSFKDNGKTFKLRGFKPRARTNIVIVEDEKGSLYRMDTERVSKLLKV